VRIEDDVLLAESGYKLLSERLPRDADTIEKIMSEGTLARTMERKTKPVEVFPQTKHRLILRIFVA